MRKQKNKEMIEEMTKSKELSYASIKESSKKEDKSEI